jgi:uncharacterized membrane protein
MNDRQPAGNVRRMTGLYSRIVRVMNGGFLLAIGLMLAGIVIGLMTNDNISRETDGPREVVPGVLRLDGQNIVELGILTLLATPAVYIIVALVTFLRERDRLFVMICLALLGILALSVGLSL